MPSQQTTSPLTQTNPSCPCGFSIPHSAIEAQYRYTIWGWCLLLTGISAKPKDVLHRCTRCKTILRKEKSNALY